MWYDIVINTAISQRVNMKEIHNIRLRVRRNAYSYVVAVFPYRRHNSLISPLLALYPQHLFQTHSVFCLRLHFTFCVNVKFMVVLECTACINTSTPYHFGNKDAIRFNEQ